ncbi:hypothetical protein PoB_003030800 [Plakobranchus ocellatus]|uniref:Uncharacterized protein n=1 Tax=Plakobranchus ocellatus TaxID=259542 RepID=A0AAV4A990_9GAST|nr:hypothetical protein PoB_003030800 [Plakobranchus ocellatus]
MPNIFLDIRQAINVVIGRLEAAKSLWRDGEKPARTRKRRRERRMRESETFEGRGRWREERRRGREGLRVQDLKEKKGVESGIDGAEGMKRTIHSMVSASSLWDSTCYTTPAEISSYFFSSVLSITVIFTRDGFSSLWMSPTSIQLSVMKPMASSCAVYLVKMTFDLQ